MHTCDQLVLLSPGAHTYDSLQRETTLLCHSATPATSAVVLQTHMQTKRRSKKCRAFCLAQQLRVGRRHPYSMHC